MATLNKNMYMELIYNTVGAYTSSLKNEIAKELIAKEKVTLYDSHANNGFKYPILVENRLEAIDITSKDEDFLWFYENWEFKKSYKYSVPLTFEFSDNNTFENIISLLTSNGKIILFDEQNDFNAPSEISCDINDCIPYFKKDGDYILFKFIMKEVIYDDSFTPIDVKYSIIISINLHRNFLEIRFDGGRFEYKSQNEYITPKIKYCIKWLKDVLGFTLYNVYADISVPNNLEMDAPDITVIIGNLLDNALQAVEKLPSPLRKILVLLKYDKGRLFIKVENSFDGKVKKKDGHIETMKSEIGHGYGLKNVERIVEKYEGCLQYSYDADMFQTKCMLYVKENVLV